MRSALRSGTLRKRVSEPGAVVDLLVLASGRRTTIGVDLTSGAFVRTSEPPRRTLLAPYTVLRGVTSLRTDDAERPDCPELVVFDEAPRPVDRVHGRAAERLLRPLLHPHNRPLLSFHGPSAPWWELHAGSVALLEPSSGPAVHYDERGLRCTFRWGANRYDLPMEDLRVLSRLDWLPPAPVGPRSLATELGFAPERVLVALGRPRNGYCAKVVAGLLPRR